MSSSETASAVSAVEAAAVENGLKARAARGASASPGGHAASSTCWSPSRIGTRLTRGRTYARKGQVISLDVTPGEVRATVQGSRARPYRVTIGLQPFGELVWAKVEIALAEQALFSAKLLAGEVPPELEEIFSAAGAPLFPTRVDDLDQRCSCPDWEVPCKHLAATFYLLAEAFDDDPFQILRWRGRDRETLLRRLRELRTDAPAEEPDDRNRAYGGRRALALADLPPPALSRIASGCPRLRCPPGPDPGRRPATCCCASCRRPAHLLGGEALSRETADGVPAFRWTA